MFKKRTARKLIATLSTIPAEQWGSTDTERDALSLCGSRMSGDTSFDGMVHTECSFDLMELFEGRGLSVDAVDDGKDPRYRQAGPKERILSVLEQIDAEEWP